MDRQFRKELFAHSAHWSCTHKSPTHPPRCSSYHVAVCGRSFAKLDTGAHTMFGKVMLAEARKHTQFFHSAPDVFHLPRSCQSLLHFTCGSRNSINQMHSQEQHQPNAYSLHVSHHSPFSCSILTTALKPSAASLRSSPSSIPVRCKVSKQRQVGSMFLWKHSLKHRTTSLLTLFRGD